MSYKVGDKVQVIDTLDNIQGKSHKYGFNDVMEEFCGSIVTIKKSIKLEDDPFDSSYFPNDGYLYRIVEDDGNWSWSSSMFKSIKQHEVKLQDKRTAIRRAEDITGCRIRSRKRKASVVCGHLRNQACTGRE